MATPASPSFEAALRKPDYDRYLSALFAPAAARRHLFALYAFNHEVAKTAESVTQPVAGLIRLQWWRETIADLYGGNIRAHETVQALAAAVRLHALPRALIEELIEARERDLEEAPFAGLAELESYCEATSGNVMRLAARVLGAGDAFDAAAREAGIAYALAGLMRVLPYRAARRNLVLPLEMLREAGLSVESVFAGRAGAVPPGVIVAIAERARSHWRVASAQAIPRRFLPAFLPAALVPLHARALTRPGFDPFRDSAEPPLHRRQLAMLRAMLRGRL